MLTNQLAGNSVNRLDEIPFQRSRRPVHQPHQHPQLDVFATKEEFNFTRNLHAETGAELINQTNSVETNNFTVDLSMSPPVTET